MDNYIAFVSQENIDDENGFCLNCHELVEFVEPESVMNVCEYCGKHSVSAVGLLADLKMVKVIE